METEQHQRKVGKLHSLKESGLSGFWSALSKHYRRTECDQHSSRLVNNLRRKADALATHERSGLMPPMTNNSG